MLSPNQILTLTISRVRFAKWEETTSIYKSGNYGSCFVASFVEYPNGIAVVDQFAPKDWVRKTDARADELTKMLAGRKVKVRVDDILQCGKDVFEGTIIG